MRRVVLATGKVGQEAIAARDEAGAPVAVVRVEQLYPWPYDQLDEIVAGYPNADELVWLQEEPENMGAWSFVKGRLYERFDDTHAIHRVSPLRVRQPGQRLPRRSTPRSRRSSSPRALDRLRAGPSAEREADDLLELGEGLGRGRRP